MESWTPPADGSPCWINVIAKDVPRAKAFYSTVFNWQFREPKIENGEPISEENLALFEVPGEKGKCPGGGITKVEKEFQPGIRNGGVMIYLYVNGLDGWEEKITKAGGKKTTEIEPEGEHAFMQHFADTEGNWVGLYTMKK